MRTVLDYSLIVCFVLLNCGQSWVFGPSDSLVQLVKFIANDMCVCVCVKDAKLNIHARKRAAFIFDIYELSAHSLV